MSCSIFVQNPTKLNSAILLLEDGTVFKGKAAGAIGTTTGEICFNTGMTGYQEVFTDPSYYGQVLIMTNVHIGNYGVNPVDEESKNPKISGLIVRNFSEHFSRQKSEIGLDEYLKLHNIVAIHGVDTRALVRHIRSKGAMNVIISSESMDVGLLQKKLDDTPSMKGLELASQVSTKEPYIVGDENAKYRISVLDFGIKKNILNCFAERDCVCKVFPAKTSLEELKAWNPDGVFLSNGPGDPSAMDYAVETTKQVLADDLP